MPEISVQASFVWLVALHLYIVNLSNQCTMKRIYFVMLCAALAACGAKESKPAANVATPTTVKAPEFNRPLSEIIDAHLERLKTTDYAALRQEQGGPGNEAIMYMESAIYIEQGMADSVSASKAAAKRLRDYLKPLQVKNFPLARRAYADRLAKLLWEENIEVVISGAGSTVITFTGGTFADNKNKQTIFDSIDDALISLRFKRAQFKWYSGDDEYTYWKIKSKADSEI